MQFLTLSGTAKLLLVVSLLLTGALERTLTFATFTTLCKSPMQGATKNILQFLFKQEMCHRHGHEIIPSRFSSTSPLIPTKTPSISGRMSL